MHKGRYVKLYITTRSGHLLHAIKRKNGRESLLGVICIHPNYNASYLRDPAEHLVEVLYHLAG
jgi:hypothetical protein